jgi:patatin-like phospholipase/acyl hydrolase
MITLEILARMEQVLGAGNDSFVLADYFDYVAGTSTGAIIAACISLGMSAAEIRKFYVSQGTAMFEKASLLRRFRYKYEDDKLSDMLRTIFGERVGPAGAVPIERTPKGDPTLGSPALRTLLMMVMRNASTDSPWPVSNNPYAKYNLRSRDDCNLALPLWQLVRASTAAPVYFPPEVVTIGPKEFVFVDGGITPYNNPAFQLFLMATLEPYKLGWKTGEKDMLIVSVGTGTSPQANANLDPSDLNLVYNATSLPSALMYAALNEQDLLCRAFGRCVAGESLDREIGDLREVKRPIAPPLFTYARYNAELSQQGLKDLDLTGIEPEDVQKLDSVEHIQSLKNIGTAVAHKRVSASHFENFP